MLKTFRFKSIKIYIAMIYEKILSQHIVLVKYFFQHIAFFFEMAGRIEILNLKERVPIKRHLFNRKVIQCIRIVSAQLYARAHHCRFFFYKKKIFNVMR